MGPYGAAAAANWLISIHKFVGPGQIPLRGSESTEISRALCFEVRHVYSTGRYRPQLFLDQ
jgi:hypothetical protein